MQGFFELKTISDLLGKLERDYNKLTEEPLNGDAAFNYFVTANCMLDWLYTDDAERRKNLKDDNIYLQICDHIASGAKHFEATRSRHKSVSAIEKQGSWGPPFSDPTWFNEKWGFQGRLDIILDGDAQEKIGQSISSLELASKLIDYWRNELRG